MQLYISAVGDARHGIRFDHGNNAFRSVRIAKIIETCNTVRHFVTSSLVAIKQNTSAATLTLSHTPVAFCSVSRHLIAS